MLTVKPAQLNFNNGVPCSTQFDDPYFSLANRLEETRYVFLQGNRLAERWKNENMLCRHFIIAELGFGFGMNFITTCDEWVKQFSNKDSHHLHYISFEKHPVNKLDFGKFHSQLNLQPEISKHIINYYPMSVSGSHRIHFNCHNITLTLIYGEALDQLEKSNFAAHAWFLDGFSPNKNPQLWNLDIAEQVNRLTQTQGTFATYSAASMVRKNFSAAGFHIYKRDGFGNKREMLTGEKNQSTKIKIAALPLAHKNWLNTKDYHYPNKTAIVIGAGMAGCITSAALGKRGWQITLIDKNNTIASESSGNPNAILMPRLSVDHDVQSQLTLQGFLYSVNYFNQLAEDSSFNWDQCGAIQIPRDNTQRERMRLITQKHTLPKDLINPVTQSIASELSQCDVAKAGWHIPCAGTVVPSLLCASLLEMYRSNISFAGNTNIKSIEQFNDSWIASDDNGKTFSADIVILANALSINQFQQTQWCSLNPKRGQITYLPQEICNINPKKILCADAYITPEINSHFITGATFITNDTQTDLREQEHKENITKLSRMIPSFNLTTDQHLNGRAAIRAVSDDRLPIAGPACDYEEFYKDFQHAALGSTRYNYPIANSYKGLYMTGGFGSRGLTWIPLCAESLACSISNEPNPLNNHLLQAIHPNRFLMRKLTKHIQSVK